MVSLYDIVGTIKSKRERLGAFGFVLGVEFWRGLSAAGACRACFWFCCHNIQKSRKKAYFEKSLFFIQSQGGALARSVAFVFVADAVAPCRAFLGLLRGCVFAWSVFGVSHFAQIGRFAIGAVL